MIATAPGKLIVSGEYAVLDGAPAVVIAVDRRVVARRVPGASPSSAFLAALATELARRNVDAHDIVVDSSAFYDGERKLGLGSSAAVTVAAAKLALPDADDDTLFDLAASVHATAQGVRGSGADLAAAIHGGVIEYTAGNPLTGSRPTIKRFAWPTSVQLIAFFTGVSADTADLVSRVAASRAGAPVAINAALTAIAGASDDLVDACLARISDGSREPSSTMASASEIIEAFARAGTAFDQLAVATGIPLVPRCVAVAREVMSGLGGTAKTTGAGGGDVGIAVIPVTADRTVATRLLIEAGCIPLELSVDPTGVDTRP